MFKLPTVLAPVAALVVAAAAFAWVPTADIKAERKGPTSFALTGTNKVGKLDVAIEDKHMFQGFKGEGKNGEQKVEFDIKSAGLGAGWVIEGKNGEMKFELKVKQKGAFSSEWEVKGKVGDKEVSETITKTADIEPAITASLIAFDI